MFPYVVWGQPRLMGAQAVDIMVVRETHAPFVVFPFQELYCIEGYVDSTVVGVLRVNWDTDKGQARFPSVPSPWFQQL
jgi:hypothetical protein